MKREDQVTTLEQSQQLSKLFNSTVPTLFVWVDISMIKGYINWHIVPFSDLKTEDDKIYCTPAKLLVRDVQPAFTASEIAAMLPNGSWAVPYRYEQLDLTSDVFAEAWIMMQISIDYQCYIVNLNGTGLFETHALTLVGCLADMLIYIISNNLYPSSCYKQLQ